MDWIMYLMLALAGAIVAVSAMLQRRRRWVEAGHSLERTLAACRSLLALVGHFQQHRGMSSALLAGDRGFAGRLEAKAREIDGLIPSLREIAGVESARVHPCLTPNELSLFQFHWGELREQLGGLSVEHSIARHSQLIEQLLQWLAALGESRVELLLLDRAERGLVRNYASRLPALTECLGQARALGASVAARHGCSAVARVRLMFLVARAESLLSQANEAGQRSPRAEQAALAVQEMAQVIRTRMLLSAGIKVAAKDYFDIATAAVDSVFAWIGECGAELQQAGSGKVDGRADRQLQGA